jgi:hypothetical protein
MARYLAALLGGGSGEHGAILEPEILATMFGPHYQPRIPGMGLAFWRVHLGAEVRVRRGQLMLRTLSPIPALYQGLRLHPDDREDAALLCTEERRAR